MIGRTQGKRPQPPPNGVKQNLLGEIHLGEPLIHIQRRRKNSRWLHSFCSFFLILYHKCGKKARSSYFQRSHGKGVLTQAMQSSIIVNMNRLNPARRAQIISALVEGNSLRSTSRMASVSINTV